MPLNAYCFEQNTGFASSSYLSIVCALKLINQDKSNLLLLPDCHQSHHTAKCRPFCFMVCWFLSVSYIAFSELRMAYWSKVMMHRIPNFTHFLGVTAGLVHIFFPNQYLHTVNGCTEWVSMQTIHIYTVPMYETTIFTFRVSCLLLLLSFTNITKYKVMGKTFLCANNNQFDRDFSCVFHAIMVKWTALI